MEKKDIIQEVGIALLCSAISLNPQSFRQIVSNHGMQPADNEEDLAAQVAALIHDKQQFVLADIKPVLQDVGYPDEMGLGVLSEACNFPIGYGIPAKNFDPVTLSIAASKIGIKNLDDLVDKIKTHKAQNDDADTKTKKDGFLKNLFSKFKNHKSTDSVADDPDAKKLADASSDPDDKKKDDDKKKKKTIMGMSQGWFIGLCVFLFLLLVFVIWLMTRAKKEKLKAA